MGQLPQDIPALDDAFFPATTAATACDQSGVDILPPKSPDQSVASTSLPPKASDQSEAASPSTSLPPKASDQPQASSPPKLPTAEKTNDANCNNTIKDTKVDVKADPSNIPEDSDRFNETAKQRKKRRQKEKRALSKDTNKIDSSSSSSSLSPTIPSPSTTLKPAIPTTLSLVEGSYIDDDPKDSSLLLNGKQQPPTQFEFVPDSQVNSFLQGFRDQLTSTPSRSPSVHKSTAQAASSLLRRASLSAAETELFLDKLALGQVHGRPRNVTPKRNRSAELHDDEPVKVTKLDNNEDSKANNDLEDNLKVEAEPAPPLAFQA